MTSIGPYEIVKELNRAPRSTLYLGRRISDNREVALKEFVVPAGVPAEFAEQILTRYVEECNWLQRCTHPNIVEVIDIIPPTPEHPAPVLVTEVLEKSLQTLIRENKPIDPQDVVLWLVQILGAIRDLHSHGIIHRDIKPSNIMFDAEGHPKIVDLGIAVLVGKEMTLSEDDVSTRYFAPELYRGRAGANFAVDIYSTGFMAYELLCGELKFSEQFRDILATGDQESLLRWTNWHCDTKSRLIPLKELVPEFPEYLSDVIAAMTEKDVMHRYQTVNEVLEALREPSQQNDDVFSLIIRQSIPTREVGSTLFPPPPPTPPPSNGKKKKLILLAAAASAVTTLCLLAVLFMMMQARQRAIVDKSIQAYYSRCIGAYRNSEYPQTREYAGQGAAYIKKMGRETKDAKYISFYTVVSKDADWIEGMESKLKKASNIFVAQKSKPIEQIEVAELEQAKSLAEALLAETLLTGIRTPDHDKLTTAKFSDIQKRASELLRDTVALIPPPAPPDHQFVELANDAAKHGKFRQALHVLLSNKVSSDSAKALQETLQVVVTSLDNGRDAFDQRALPEAQAAFKDAWISSKNASLEAAYYLQKVNAALLGSLNPASAIEWQTLDVAPSSIERRLIDVMVRINAYFINVSDLAQEGREPELDSITRESDSLLVELQNHIAKGEGNEFYDARPAEGIKYPIEDSRGYFANLVADLLRQKYRLALALGQVEVARDFLDQLQPLIPSVEYEFHQAAILVSEDIEHNVPGAADRAIEVFNRVLAQNPNWAECYFRLGCLYYLSATRENYSDALRSMQQARELMPQNERYKWWHARIANDYGAKLIGEGDCNGALKTNEDALNIWPDFPAAWFGIAESYRCMQKDAEADQAVEKFRSAIKARKYTYSVEDEYMKLLDGVAKYESRKQVLQTTGLFSKAQ